MRRSSALQILTTAGDCHRLRNTGSFQRSSHPRRFRGLQFKIVLHVLEAQLGDLYFHWSRLHPGNHPITVSVRCRSLTGAGLRVAHRYLSAGNYGAVGIDYDAADLPGLECAEIVVVPEIRVEVIIINAVKRDVVCNRRGKQIRRECVATKLLHFEPIRQ